MHHLCFPLLLGLAGCASSPQRLEPVTKLYDSPTSDSTNQNSAEVFVYDQKPLPGQPSLVAPEQAQAVIEKFKTAYEKLGSPRMLLYVNRELVDEKTGMKLIARTEKTETTRRRINSSVESGNRGSNSININAGRDVTVNGSTDYPGKGKISDTTDKVSNENRYRIEERDAKLADRQTVRDVERLFGRPLRAAGVSLADQSVATQLIADRPLKSFVVNAETEAGRKDREALAKITDVAIEVLISSRNINVPGISGDATYSVPDIQATAVSLKDSKIIGQASSRDVLGRDRDSGRVARNFDVQEIAEATALALMDDMAANAK